MSTVKLKQQVPLQTAVLKPQDTVYWVLSQRAAEGPSRCWYQHGFFSGIQVVNIACAKDVSGLRSGAGGRLGLGVYNPPKSPGCPWL